MSVTPPGTKYKAVNYIRANGAKLVLSSAGTTFMVCFLLLLFYFNTCIIEWILINLM